VEYFCRSVYFETLNNIVILQSVNRETISGFKAIYFKSLVVLRG